MPLGVHVALLVAAVLAYYRLETARRVSEWAVGRVRPRLMRLDVARRASPDALENVLALLVAAVLQLAFLAVAWALSGVPAGDLWPDSLRPELIGYGAVLGVGEGVLASYAALIAIEAASALAPGRVPAQRDEWMTVARGGWMRRFLRTAEVAPWWWLLAMAALYVAVEEALFRGVAISLLHPLGGAVAVAGSVALFVVPQLTQAPSWHTALFPLVGAVVIGTVNGLLFLAVPDLLPLVVAHVVLVSMTILYPGGRGRSTRVVGPAL